MTPAGIEPATFRFVAQHLNHCAAGEGPRETGGWASTVGEVARVGYFSCFVCESAVAVIVKMNRP